MSYFSWRPYVPVAKRQREAERELAKLAKRGMSPSPVKIEGRKIANSFWGRSWCENLERYSDFASRLPRGRSYVRNGLVVDLEITRGEVAAKVSGSELYNVTIGISPVKAPRWRAICRDCAGSIDFTDRTSSGSSREERHGTSLQQGRRAISGPRGNHIVLQLPRLGGYVQAHRRRALRRRRSAR
jgi:hypothetical protein